MVFLVEAHLKVTSEPVLVQVKGHCMPFRATKPFSAKTAPYGVVAVFLVILNEQCLVKAIIF